ncbi:hypothetical protein ACWDRB_60815 [Nonomuraea sp. NPDC003707]
MTTPEPDWQRARWNPHVLGLLAYPMAARPADPAWGVPPVNSGTHLRWTIDPRRGMPGGGFHVYRRPHQPYASDRSTLARSLELTTRPTTAPAATLTVDAGEPRPLTLAHPGTIAFMKPWGVGLPTGAGELTITLPTTARQVALYFAGVQPKAWLRALHGRRLVARLPIEPAFEGYSVVLIVDPVDQIVVSAPAAWLARITWLRVPGDLEGWQPLGRIPPLGTAPLDVAGIAGRLDPDEVPGDRVAALADLIAAVRRGPAAEPVVWRDGGSALRIPAGMVLSALTVRPRPAWAFGFYLVDPDPPDEPADYLVTGVWQAWAQPPPRSRVLPAEPLDQVLELLREPAGLMYFAPAYAVSPDRAWAPAGAALAEFAVVAEEVRRSLDPEGVARLEAPLRIRWTARTTEGEPEARQIPALAVVAVVAPGGPAGPHAVVPAVNGSGIRESRELISAPLDDLPATAQLALTPVDPFGHTETPGLVASTAVPAELYPLPPPPVGITARIDAADLEIAWLWGGRSRLFHPGSAGFDLDWVQDTDLPPGIPSSAALADPALVWRALPRVPATPPAAARVEDLAPAWSGICDRGLLRGSLGGVRTALALAEGAVGRLDGWRMAIGGQEWTVAHHTVGPAVWLFVRLPAGAPGTPFEGLTEDTEADLAVPWSLTPPTGTQLLRISAAAPVPGALLTQGPQVFGLLGRLGDRVLVEHGTAAQEPGAPLPAAPLPVLGDTWSDAPTVHRVPGPLIDPPTPAHPVRTVWVRVRTVDFLGRPGPASAPVAATWAKDFPPVPDAGPFLVRGSASDAFGRCRLLIRFTETLAAHEYRLYRASDDQLRLVWRRWVGRGAAFGGLPPGFVWPDGLDGPQDVTDPVADLGVLPDSLRVFVNEVRADGEPAFAGAFEARGTLHRLGEQDARTAETDGAPLELEDVADRPGNDYLYLVRPVDLAGQEGPASGVSAPARGLDIANPPAPRTLPPLRTPAAAIIRWMPVADPRVTGYRVTAAARWAGGPPPQVTAGDPGLFPSPLRAENDRIPLPGLQAPVSVRLVGAAAERLDDGHVHGDRFAFWFAAGTPALIEVEGAGAGVRDRVPAEYGHGLANGSSVDPVPVRLVRGVLDGAGLGEGPFTGLTIAGTDASPYGSWLDTAFLSCLELAEGEQVVLELSEQAGQLRRTFGRCPAAPALEPIRVGDGVIRPGAGVSARLAAGDRVTGVFRAAQVTKAGLGGSPDPRAADALDLRPSTRTYSRGLARRLRDRQPVVVRFTPVAGGGSRFLATDRAGRPLWFLDGVLALPPWDPARETLSGLYEGQVTSGAGLLAHTVANPATGLVSVLLPDDVPVVPALGGAPRPARFVPLTWRGHAVAARGLLGDGALQLTAVYGMEPDGQGGWVPNFSRNRVAEVTVHEGEIRLTDPPPEGARARIVYPGTGPITLDPGLLAWELPLDVDSVGRSWEIRVEAICTLPAPVTELRSRPAVVLLDVSPPDRLALALDAEWTADLRLRVVFDGPAGLHYRIEAVAGSRTLLIADRPPGFVVSTGTAADGSALPLDVPLTVRVRAQFPNAAKEYVAPAVLLAPPSI